jgi:shikimate kinase
MGAGKSAVARVLAARLGVAVADLDARLEDEAGAPVAEQFARAGEAAFRAREHAALRHALDGGAGVVACGGGVVLDPANRELLRRGCRVVWLEVSPAAAARRVAAEPGARPLLAGASPGERLAALLAERAPLYAEVAAVRVGTDGRTPEAVAEAVLAALAEGGA